MTKTQTRQEKSALRKKSAYHLCDVLLTVVMLVLIWKRMLPLKSMAQRMLASLCNPMPLRE